MVSKLELITGRAGTGKTRALFERVAEARKLGGAECFVIVPEQATFETERSLSELLSGGLMGVTVTSWSNLARKLLDSMGARQAFLSPQGRVMLLRRCVDAAASKLTVFKRSAQHRGFPAECDGLIADLKRCGMDPESVAEAAQSLDEGLPLRDKLNDISVIFSELERRCADRYIDPEDMMNELISRAHESALCGAHVFIDGGDTMHEQAFALFEKMLLYSASVTAALTADASSRDRGLFAPEERTIERLIDIAEKNGVSVVKTALHTRMRKGTPAICHLERELFAFPGAVFEGEPEGLLISVSPDRTDEVTEAAERIREAAKRGVRYREMAVIVSDLASYAHIAERVFAQYGIPYFTDVKRSLISYPAAGFILNALSAAEHGFDAQNMFEVVGSGFLPITEDEAELFENHMLAKGLYGKRLTEPIENDEKMEDIRRRVMEPMIALHESVRIGSCESRARAVHCFMQDLGLYEKQKELCASLHEEGRYREENENAQVINTVLEVLDQLYVIMGDGEIGLKRFIAVLKEGFAAYEVGTIPATCDQVLVGSMSRTRSREVRLLIVLGMNDGLFPKKRSDDGVIDDADLKMLKSRGYELWRSTEGLSQSDLLTVYSALSKATEQIVFSYPAAISGAGAMSPAASACRLIGSIRRIFPRIPEINCITAGRRRSSEEAAFASLGRRLRRMIDTGVPDDEAAMLYSRFSASPEYKERLAPVTAECFGTRETAPLGRELSKLLYGSSLYGSASRLENFNSCPFRHFMQYGLCAKERDERKEKNTELGSFYHEALEHYVRYVMESGLDWTDIDDEKTYEILKEILPGIMYREGGHLLYDTARQRARLWNVIETVRATCCAVTRHIAAGSFRPQSCEVSFGRADSVFPALKVEAGELTFNISGVIDRIDSYKSGDKEKSRIIDYKSGGKRFTYEELAAGLQLQLPLYAAAVDAAQTVGMYYMPITDIEPGVNEDGEAVRVMTDELMKKFRLHGLSLRDEEVICATDPKEGSSSVIYASHTGKGELKGSGLVDEKELEDAMEFAKRKAAATLDRIFEGDASVFPARLKKAKKAPCRFCPYSDVCRFDPDLSRTGYNDIPPMSADAFFGRRD